MPIVKNGKIAGSSILCLNKVRKNKRDKEQKMHYFIRDFTGLMLTDIAQAKRKKWKIDHATRYSCGNPYYI